MSGAAARAERASPTSGPSASTSAPARAVVGIRAAGSGDSSSPVLSGPTRAEICIVACADLFAASGEVLVSPFGVVPTLGARLARLTQAPELVLTDGEATLLADTPPLGQRGLVPEAPMRYRQVFDVVWAGRRHAMMMASQLDRHGNHNISAIGDWRRPTAQLVGVRGAPGNSVCHATSYWVPNHSPRVFVERVDVVCGVGTDRTRALGPAARYADLRGVVTNLGVFDFGGPDSTMRLVTLHPGVTLEEVEEATGFALARAAPLLETRLPTDEELVLLRTVLDPGNARSREVPT
jgi:acyl CoA:acetate/3-ketoacid CoA transferase beta subunit